MPKLSDPGELELIKQVHGFLPPTPINSDLEPREQAERALKRQKKKVNKAR